MACEIIHGDALEVLKGMEANSVDAVVTDPPYGLVGASRGSSSQPGDLATPYGRSGPSKKRGGFMGKEWDASIPGAEYWSEALRIAKPGAYLLAFGGTRTFHRLAVAIEDAGWEIRDTLMWVYGSGFPKSHNVAIGIDKMNGAQARGKALVVAGRGEREDLQGKDANPRPQDLEAYAPATQAAKQWQGWGTALKPAWEPIIMARKPLVGTIAQNVQAHGTGAINVDGCRVGTDGATKRGWQAEYPKNEDGTEDRSGSWARVGHSIEPLNLGRWPANLIHDGSDEVLAGFPDTGKSTGGGKKNGDKFGGGYAPTGDDAIGYGDTGSAARFFKTCEHDEAASASRLVYCAKASKADRGESNGHPTVKPTELMRYLVRLVTQPGGTVLDPFTGSGSTGKAAVLEGFEFIGIEREAEYVAIAEARIVEAQRSLGLFA